MPLPKFCLGAFFALGDAEQGSTEADTVAMLQLNSRGRAIRTDRETLRNYIVGVPDGYTGSALKDVCDGLQVGHCVVSPETFEGILPFIVLRSPVDPTEQLLQSYPDLEYVEQDRLIQEPLESGSERADGDLKFPWGLYDSQFTDNFDSSTSWDACRNGGKATHTYVVGSGINSHADFGNRLVPTLDFLSDDGVPQACEINGLHEAGRHSSDCTKDGAGSGSHTAGVVGGTQTGAARSTYLHAVRVLNSHSGYISSVNTALRWIAKFGERPAVVMLAVQQSSANDDEIKSYHRSVDALMQAGVQVVVPAGYDRDFQDGAWVASDACKNWLRVESGILVGARDRTQEQRDATVHSSFSNYGECVDITGPGDHVLTTDAFSSGHTYVGSTAQAAAHAAAWLACELGSGEGKTTPADLKKEMLTDGKSPRRRRRAPRRRTRTTDEKLYFKSMSEKLHRRRESHRRRRVKDPEAPEVPQFPVAEKTIVPTYEHAASGPVPIYGMANAANQWLAWFQISDREEHLWYQASFYGATSSKRFCANLPGGAKCIFKGRPHEGGQPFVMFRATDAELEEIVKGSCSKRDSGIDQDEQDSTPCLDFVEADMPVTSIAEVEETEAETSPGPLPQEHTRRRRGLPWNLDALDSLDALDGSYQVPVTGGSRDYGEGLKVSSHVYVLDAGIRTTHDEFEGRAIPTLDISTGCLEECQKEDTTCAEDNLGSGTHVAAVVAGARYGVAKAATLHAVKTLKDDGTGWISWVIAALDWIGRKGHNHFDKSLSDIVLYNFRLSSPSHSFRRAMKFAYWSADMTQIIAAGNYGDGTSDTGLDACQYHPQGIWSETKTGYDYEARPITVGATTMTDKMAVFSNFGQCLDSFGLAPGSAILTASHTSNVDSVHVSGTTLAAAHVAGAVALLLASEKAEDKTMVRVHLHLAGLHNARIDIPSDKRGLQNSDMIYVRDMAISQTFDEADTECASCQHSLSGCACMKEWEYPGGKCENYCCDPFADQDETSKQEPNPDWKRGWCKTWGKCTVQYEDENPFRSSSDACDTVPGKRVGKDAYKPRHEYKARYYIRPDGSQSDIRLDGYRRRRSNWHVEDSCTADEPVSEQDEAQPEAELPAEQHDTLPTLPTNDVDADSAGETASIASVGPPETGVKPSVAESEEQGDAASDQDESQPESELPAEQPDTLPKPPTNDVDAEAAGETEPTASVASPPETGVASPTETGVKPSGARSEEQGELPAHTEADSAQLSPKQIVGNIQAELDCLKHRLDGEPCDAN